MPTRSTTSQYQPSPPNYTTLAGIYRNVGRYRAVTRGTGPVSANMCTAPTTAAHTQYQYIPRLNG